MSQPGLPFNIPLRVPDGEIVVCYGGGVNSVAMLVALHLGGVTPRAITMADPGSEHAGTISYRDTIMAEWCARVGFPPIVVLERRLVGIGRPRTWRLETLRDECLRTESLPSIAYGWKKCSLKHKAEPQRWWLEAQPWAQEAWAAGRKLVRAMGYDLDEGRRVKKANAVDRSGTEERLFDCWYPLFDLALDRDGCEGLIRQHGLPVPPKSACTFCPNNTLEEWERLRAEEPEKFAEAVEMSRNAKLDAPEVVGLMRCNPHGKRQLHVWADGGYGSECGGGGEDEMPCECAT